MALLMELIRFGRSLGAVVGIPVEIGCLLTVCRDEARDCAISVGFCGRIEGQKVWRSAKMNVDGKVQDQFLILGDDKVKTTA